MDETLRHESTPIAMKLTRSGQTFDEGFESIFQENWDPIRRHIARMVVDPAEAEDLTLETFHRLYLHSPSQADGFNARAWLYKVATNLALQSIRSFKRREQYELRAGRNALVEAGADSPSKIFAKKEAEHFARATLGSMNPRKAEILVMKYSGLSYKEIAAAMRLSPTSIGPLLVRAEREFEKIYRELSREEEK